MNTSLTRTEDHQISHAAIAMGAADSAASGQRVTLLHHSSAKPSGHRDKVFGLPDGAGCDGAALYSQTGAKDVLFAEFRPLIQRLIRKYGDDAELRKDLEGEIYCIFCNLLEAFDPGRGVPLRAYLVHQLTASTYTVARRHWRQERREVSIELRENVDSDLDPSSRWDDNIMLQDVRKLLPAGIARLPLRQRQVVIWRHYEHKSFEEIAVAMGVQTATTRSLLRHAMNNLRRYFEEANFSL